MCYLGGMATTDEVIASLLTAAKAVADGLAIEWQEGTKRTKLLNPKDAVAAARDATDLRRIEGDDPGGSCSVEAVY